MKERNDFIMDKATKERFQMMIEHYRSVAAELNVSLQELLLLILSEQIKDTFVDNERGDSE